MTPSFIPSEDDTQTVTAHCECGERVEYPRRYAGRRIQCQSCGNHIVIGAAPKNPSYTGRRVLAVLLMFAGFVIIVAGAYGFFVADVLAKAEYGAWQPLGKEGEAIIASKAGMIRLTGLVIAAVGIGVATGGFFLGKSVRRKKGPAAVR